MPISLRPKTYSYRSQRYHAWDVVETSPRVIVSLEGVGPQILPILNFSEEGLCIECPANALPFKAGDLLPSLQVLFGDQTFLTGKAKIKHVTRYAASGSWHCGLRFTEGKLNISEIFALRGKFQDHSLVVDRLRRIQRAPRYGRDLLDQLEIQAYFEWKGKKIPIHIENVSEFGFYFSLDAMTDVELFTESLLQPNIVLEKFYFSVDGKPLFEGRVRIAHVKKEPSHLKIGCFCVDGSSVFLIGFETALKLREVKKGFFTFWEKVNQSQRIHPEFKIALNDFRYFLESMKAYLERSENLSASQNSSIR